MTWDEARPICEGGQPVRRRAWPAVTGDFAWLICVRGLFFIQQYRPGEVPLPASAPTYVRNVEFRDVEFLAGDWVTYGDFLADSDLAGDDEGQPEIPFACEVFDPRWWGEFEEWDQLVTIADDWEPPVGFQITKMCIRWVGICTNDAGIPATAHVVGWKPGLAVQLTIEEYISLALPYHHPIPNTSTVIALEFYGLRPVGGPRPRPCIGTTNKYNLWRKPL